MSIPLFSLSELIDNAACYEKIRELRWSGGISCPHCGSHHIIKRGHKENNIHHRRYSCKSCGKRFDDLSETALSGHHQPLSIWILCLYFMGLNLSNHQIAQELNLNKDDVQYMTQVLREGIDKKKRNRTYLEKLNVMKFIS